MRIYAYALDMRPYKLLRTTHELRGTPAAETILRHTETMYNSIRARGKPLPATNILIRRLAREYHGPVRRYCIPVAQSHTDTCRHIGLDARAARISALPLVYATIMQTSFCTFDYTHYRIYVGLAYLSVFHNSLHRA